MDTTEIIKFVEQAKSGDNEAFGKLVSQFEGLVYSIALRRLKNPSDAREVTQDIFVQAMRKLDQLREPECFAGWLKQIAARTSINRAMRRPKEMTRNPDMFNHMNSEPVSPLDNLLRNEQAHQVYGGLKRLRDMDRKTLIAFYFEGQSLKEMSNTFESPVGTIKRRLHTARNRLREELSELQPA